MANKSQLRIILSKNIKNKKSKHEDKKCKKVVSKVIKEIKKNMNVELEWRSNIYLKYMVDTLRQVDKNIEFSDVKRTSNIRPDGGILYLLDKNKNKYIILISEMKSQGTNDARKKEGKSEQALENAVERLGKNVIGFRTLMHNEAIFPFVCFGDGCDFNDKKTIIDRVKIIAMFGKVNETYLENVKSNNLYYNRGSYYFRVKDWTEKEMFNIMYDIAERSIYYYFSVYGEKNFVIK